MRHNVDGTVYLLHFAEPFKHARHYLGWTEYLPRRLEQHRSGQGAKLMYYVNQAHIDWQCVRIWGGTRAREKQLKHRGGHSRICPVCLAARREAACKTS